MFLAGVDNKDVAETLSTIMVKHLLIR